MNNARSVGRVLVGFCLFAIAGVFVYQMLRTKGNRDSKSAASTHRVFAAARVSQSAIKKVSAALAATKAEGRTKTDEVDRSWEAQWLFRNNFYDYLRYSSPKGFKLTDHEKEVLAHEVYDFQLVCGKLKKTSQMYISREGNLTVVTIPARPELAAVTWTTFEEYLAASLSPEEADRIARAIGPNLVSLCDEFGDVDETYTIIAPIDTSGSYQYSYSANVPMNNPDYTKPFIGNHRGSTASGFATLKDFANDPNDAFLEQVLSGH